MNYYPEMIDVAIGSFASGMMAVALVALLALRLLLC